MICWLDNSQSITCGNILFMTTIEAIYENGIFKPISGLPHTLKEHDLVRVIIESDADEDLVREFAEWEGASDSDLTNFERSLGEIS